VVGTSGNIGGVTPRGIPKKYRPVLAHWVRSILDQGMTQTELAEKVGKKQGTISDILHGNRGTSWMVAEQLASLAKVADWRAQLGLPGDPFPPANSFESMNVALEAAIDALEERHWPPWVIAKLREEEGETDHRGGDLAYYLSRAKEIKDGRDALAAKILGESSPDFE
jgi:transcriptional regulator with XRE-family HTH domain